MGQQQLLLVLLAIIIVGVAIVTGLSMYVENARAANQDEVRDALLTVAARARMVSTAGAVGRRCAFFCQHLLEQDQFRSGHDLRESFFLR